MNIDNNSKTFHIIGELVVAGGILYYVNNKSSQLEEKITILEKKVLELSEIISKMSLQTPVPTLGHPSGMECSGNSCPISKRSGPAPVRDRRGEGGNGGGERERSPTRVNKNVMFNGFVKQHDDEKSENVALIGSPSMKYLSQSFNGHDMNETEHFSKKVEVETRDEGEIDALVKKSIKKKSSISVQ